MEGEKQIWEQKKTIEYKNGKAFIVLIKKDCEK